MPNPWVSAWGHDRRKDQSIRPNADMTRLLAAQREVIASQAIFNGVTQGGFPYHLDPGTVTEAHFQEATLQIAFAGDRNHVAGLSDT